MPRQPTGRPSGGPAGDGARRRAGRVLAIARAGVAWGAIAAGVAGVLAACDGSSAPAGEAGRGAADTTEHGSRHDAPVPPTPVLRPGAYTLRTFAGQPLPALITATPDRARTVWVVGQSVVFRPDGRFTAWSVGRRREGRRTTEDTARMAGTYGPAPRTIQPGATVAIELRDGRGATAVLDVSEGGRRLEGYGLPRFERGTAVYRPYTYERVAGGAP